MRSLPSSLPSPYLSGLGSQRLPNASRDRRGPGPARSAKTLAEPRRQRLWRFRGRDRLGGRDHGRGASSRRPAPPAGTRGAQPGAPAPPGCLPLPPASPAVAPGSCGSAATCGGAPARLGSAGTSAAARAARPRQPRGSGPGLRSPGRSPGLSAPPAPAVPRAGGPAAGEARTLRDPDGSRPRRREPPRHPGSGCRRR